MILTSPAFVYGGKIPYRFTCEGQNLSPPLRWREAPKKAKSFVLLFDDPDASKGPLRHWAAFDIPAYHAELTEGAGAPEGFEDFRHAINDFKHFGYDGPCPPPRRGAHHYRFRLLALKIADLPIRTHPDCQEVEKEAMKYVLAEAILVGLYGR